MMNKIFIRALRFMKKMVLPNLELPINLHQYFIIHILQEVGVELKVSI
jgi:hypothetical protein